MGAQGRVMWVDATANLVRTVKKNGVDVIEDFTTTHEGVVDIIRKCKAAKF